MKWPQLWVDIINHTALERMITAPPEWGPDIALYILDNLHKAGALKDLPEPREFLIGLYGTTPVLKTDDTRLDHADKIIKVREVLDE